MDWIRFLDDYSIDYATRGPNVKRGNVNIACPLCGDDPSHHLGIDLHSEKWGCWRSSSHSGLKAKNLIKHVLGCSFTQAANIAAQYGRSDPESLDDAITLLKALDGDDKPDKRAQKTLTYRKEFKTIKNKGTTKPYFDYLARRHFDDVDRLCEIYDLRCALYGDYGNRVIIPIFKNSKLVSWTSRAITNPKNAPRYLALSEDAGGLVNVFDALFNWDELEHEGDLLFIVEGPFDALKLDFYGIRYNVTATCTFGTAMSDEQALMLTDYSKNFDKAVLLYDPEAVEAIFTAQSKLAHTGIEIGSFPHELGDPGAMTKKQTLKFIKSYLK